MKTILVPVTGRISNNSIVEKKKKRIAMDNLNRYFILTFVFSKLHVLQTILGAFISFPIKEKGKEKNWWRRDYNEHKKEAYLVS